MHNRKIRNSMVCQGTRICLAVGFMALTQSIWAQSVSARYSMRAEAWSGSRHLEDEGPVSALSLWTNGKLRADDNAIFWNAWARGQNQHTEYTHARVRELYWRRAFDTLDLKVGRLMPAWGRADGINPTDNLTAKDFTLLAPEDADLRSGNDGVQVDYFLPGNSGTLSATWFERARSHRIPLEAVENVHYQIHSSPRKNQWALKWDYIGSGIDASISYFYGEDPFPNLSLESVSLSGVDIALRNARSRFLGADLSVQRGAIVWRAEMAWAQPNHYDAADYAHKKPTVWLVGGPEWRQSGWTVGSQLVWQWVRDFQSPDALSSPIARDVAWRQAATSSQVAAQQGGITLRVVRRMWNETLTAETTILSLWQIRASDSQQASGLWRSKLDYAVDDHWNVLTGFEIPFGPAHSQFGQLKKNRLAYVQLRRSF